MNAWPIRARTMAPVTTSQEAMNANALVDTMATTVKTVRTCES